MRCVNLQGTKIFYPLFCKDIVFFSVLSVRIRTIFVRIRTETFLFFSPQNSGKQRDKIMAHYLISL